MTPIIWSQSVRCRLAARLLFLAAAGWASGLLIGGCAASTPARFGESQSPGAIQVLADWADLDAAIDVAAERSEMALFGASKPTADDLVRRFELRTVAAEPVLIIVTRPEPLAAGSTEPQPLTIRAKVGRFGSPEREAKLLERLIARLEQLRGVDFSPL